MDEVTNSFFISVAEVLQKARHNARTAVNLAMVYAYFEIGRLIVEEEQKGRTRAEYGKYVLNKLAEYLSERFGKGYSVSNLKQMRQFYMAYSEKTVCDTESVLPENEEKPIGQTVSVQSEEDLGITPNRRFSLSWSHYLKLMRISDVKERKFYEIESARNDWSLRELKRQYDSSLYERLLLSGDKNKVKALSTVGQIIEKPEDIVRDPYVLEFLGLPELPMYSESELERRLVDNLQTFLLELGRGFTFVGRQQRFTFGEEHFRVDLVFYNRLLRCFVLFDLKIGELKHQDIGQMQMYVNYYDREIKLPEENSTIGIVLCRDKNDAVVKMTLPEDNKQIFASKYETVLPSKEELRRLLCEDGEDSYGKVD